MDLDTAIARHTEWKVRLRAAITRRETLDDATISRDDCCELGQWLHGEAQSQLALLPSFTETVARHAAFHREAGRVAVAINARDYSTAAALLGMTSAYTGASSAVTIALGHLRKEAELVPFP